jgi:hypothetical protein
MLSGEHTCRGTSGAVFTWVFSDDGFKISGGGKPIPQEVLYAILGNDAEAKVIEGKWTYVEANPNGALTLSGIKADHKGGFKDVVLTPWNTGVVRITFGETQFTFAPKR